ncbi:MAG: hypothetical protein LBC12_00310 [Nitrososphaerota archaeon]|jgi:hypothetical protein|nr:hypothetical protein [Nitrososphaerota archaeon]
MQVLKVDPAKTVKDYNVPVCRFCVPTWWYYQNERVAYDYEGYIHATITKETEKALRLKIYDPYTTTAAPIELWIAKSIIIDTQKL